MTIRTSMVTRPESRPHRVVDNFDFRAILYSRHPSTSVILPGPIYHLKVKTAPKHVGATEVGVTADGYPVAARRRIHAVTLLVPRNFLGWHIRHCGRR